jgi:hypothetical protein
MMSKDLLLWTLDDCIQFAQRTMKSFMIDDSEQIFQEISASFRKNLVTGSALMKFSDEVWKEIIAPAGLRRHIREHLKKIIKAEEQAALSQLHRRGLPKKSVDEKAAIEAIVLEPLLTGRHASRFSQGVLSLFSMLDNLMRLP